jgi:hypothetical protein
VLYGRLKPFAKQIIGQYQCGFRERGGWSDEGSREVGSQKLEDQGQG